MIYVHFAWYRWGMMSFIWKQIWIYISNHSWDNGVSWYLWRRLFWPAKAYMWKFFTTRNIILELHLSFGRQHHLGPIFCLEIIAYLSFRWFGLKMPIHSQNNNSNPPKVIREEPHCHPSRQRMNSSIACASYAMTIADESIHSTDSTLHPHHTGMRRRHIPR